MTVGVKGSNTLSAREPPKAKKGKFARIKLPTKIPPGGPTNRAERRALAALERRNKS